ncbi:MAG: alpha/beta hydrolase [Polyangiales bacterium]
MSAASLAPLHTRIVRSPKARMPPDTLVLLLHGYGAPGDDLVALADALAPPPHVALVFPAAPLTPPALGGFGRAWWPLDIERLLGGDVALLREEPAGLEDARRALHACLSAVRAELDAACAKLILGGFSQGAMTALDFALEDGMQAGALWLMSGAPMCAARWSERLPRLKGVPVLQSHGRQDAVLPFAAAEALRDQLCAAGCVHQWLPFDGGHGISAEMVAAMRAGLP